MPKIVHLCLSCFYIDGYAYQENILPKHHVLMGYDVTVIASLVSFNSKGESCLLDKASTYFDNENKYKVIRLNYKGNRLKYINKILRRYTGLYDSLEQEKPDIIFMHGITYCDVIHVKKYIKRNPNVKLYADSHADNINSGNHFLSKNFLIPIVWKNCIKIIEPYIIKCFGVTPSRKEYVIEKYKFPKEKTDLLVLGVDDSVIPENREEIKCTKRQQLGIMPDDFVIITGGKIDDKKNIHILLETVKEINNSNIHIIVFGVIIPEADYLFNEYMLNTKFHFIGWCNHKDVINYMISSDLACFPGTHSTLWEEAVGLGIPAIFKEWKGMTHLNTNDNCIFLNIVDKEILKNSINSLFINEEYYNKKKNAVIASQYFLYSNIAKKAIEL